MALLITLAVFPLLWGIVQLIKSRFQKAKEVQNVYKIYGITKVVIGIITGAFLTFVYLSYDFFLQRIGNVCALLICWIVITICDIIARAKLGIDEYDKKQAENNEE